MASCNLVHCSEEADFHALEVHWIAQQAQLLKAAVAFLCLKLSCCEKLLYYQWKLYTRQNAFQNEIAPGHR